MSSTPPFPQHRKHRWSWRRWLTGLAILLVVAWVVLNHLLPVWAPRLVLRKIELPGARVRALARIMEEQRERIGQLGGPPTGEHEFHCPWMRRTDEWENEHYVLPVQWSFRDFLRSGSLWEKRAVLGAASMRGCGECVPELAALLAKEEPAWRIKVAYALGEIATAEALTEVEKLTTAPEPEMRIAALGGLYRPSGNPALRGRTLVAARRLYREDPDEAVRRQAADFLLWQRVSCDPRHPAVPFDEEIAALFRTSCDDVRRRIAETHAAAAWHRTLDSAWLPEVERAWREDSDPHVKANAALVFILQKHPRAPEAITFLETLCPSDLQPLTEEKLRAAMAKHLPYGLCYKYLETRWKQAAQREERQRRKS